MGRGCVTAAIISSLPLHIAIIKLCQSGVYNDLCPYCWLLFAWVALAAPTNVTNSISGVTRALGALQIRSGDPNTSTAVQFNSSVSHSDKCSVTSRLATNCPQHRGLFLPRHQPDERARIRIWIHIPRSSPDRSNSGLGYRIFAYPGAVADGSP